jgi:hypothetical protein
MPLPDLRSRVVVPALLAVCLLAFTFASAAAAAKTKTVPGQIRVIDSKGRILAQQTQYTGDGVSIKSDKKADCFGSDNTGSGKRVDVPGFTALSQLIEASDNDKSIRPVSLTDAFSFGLAVCGIGKAVSDEAGFWYVKENHEAAQVGSDQLEIDKGDQVLWYLIKDASAPPPDELALSAPAAAKSGQDVTVKVVSYADDGKKSPAEGVDVEGAKSKTDAKGKTTVPADEPMLALTGTRKGSIPSNTVYVCVQGPGECPAGYAEVTAGTKGADKIKVGDISTTVLAGAGDDRITATSGKYGDDFDCGSGDDLVTVSKTLKKLSGFSGCERVKVAR